MSDWLYQCTCFGDGGDQEAQTVDDTTIAVVDENGEFVNIEKPAEAVAVPTKEEETKEPEPATTTKSVAAASTAAVVAPAAVAASKAATTTKEIAAVAETKVAAAETKPTTTTTTEVKEVATKVATTAAASAPAAAPKEKNQVVVDLKTFKAELKEGIPIVKHCRNGKMVQRTLILDPTETKLGWKKTQKGDTMIALKDVLSVRAATELDPSTVGDPKHPKGMGGTAVLRKTCDGPTVMKRAFSLIMKDRTLDIEMPTELQAKKMITTFKVLVQKAKE